MIEMAEYCVLCGNGPASAIEWSTGVCDACTKVWVDDNQDDESENQAKGIQPCGGGE